ncbi:MAG: ABC transporter substrate-binding protein [Candidatus Dormibacteraeota bacterium]|nr:ABC transporter substrate-binding protein [Candidatus Dormibacteraeota bacterium]
MRATATIAAGRTQAPPSAADSGDAHPLRRARLVSILTAAVLTACGTASSATPAVTDSGPVTLRFGYFPNLTHATALVGVQKGFLASALGSNVTLENHTFNAGPEEVTSLLSGALDAGFLGPNPAVNAYVQSHGEAVRIIAGGSSGGALLVVKPSIASPSDLRGKMIADPQLGGTQDIALRWYLKNQGLNTDAAGGGDVHVLPQENATTLTAFRQGQVDGAWLPEPWASRLIVEGGAKVLVDERDLWPGGKFITTNLVVRTEFLKAHPGTVHRLLEGLYTTNAYLNSNPAESQAAVNSAIALVTGKALAANVMSGAWTHMTFTLDPLAASLKASADHQGKVGLTSSSIPLKGIYDLKLLNEVLSENQVSTVSGL